MTTQTDHLKLIKSTIDTQYDLARIELFRPFEIFDRYHGIKLSHECGMLRSKGNTFTSQPVHHFPRAKEAWDALIARVAPFDKAALEVNHPEREVMVSREVYENIAACACGKVEVRTFSVRVSILWNGRTLMREYVLPEAGK